MSSTSRPESFDSRKTPILNPILVDEAKEVQQHSHWWYGTPPELALVLQRELGVTEDIVPLKARYIQLTAFFEDKEQEDRHVARWTNGYTFNAMVTFYDENLRSVIDGESSTVTADFETTDFKLQGSELRKEVHVNYTFDNFVI